MAQDRTPLAVAGGRVEVEGAEHLDAPRPAVFAFDHQSDLDPLVVCKVVLRDFTSTGKAEVRKDPAAALTARALDGRAAEAGPYRTGVVTPGVTRASYAT